MLPHTSRSGPVLAVACMLLLGSTLASCRPAGQRRPEPAPSSNSAPQAVPQRGQGPTTRPLGEHWVQDERLRGLMRMITGQSTPDTAELPGDPEEPDLPGLDNVFADAAALADSLVMAAEQIPASVADRPMSDEDRRGF